MAAAFPDRRAETLGNGALPGLSPAAADENLIVR
jgi:hypothetical protein